jgi:hypothetical protein
MKWDLVLLAAQLAVEMRPWVARWVVLLVVP